MTKRSLLAACGAASVLVVVASAKAPVQPPVTAAPSLDVVRATSAAAAQATRPDAQTVTTAAQEAALINQYCTGCHNEKARAAATPNLGALKLTFDDLDPANVSKDAEKWELVVRKLRAGMMPPANLRRPDPPVFESMITFLENELDRQASPFMPPPGLHRLNRTEYANMIRDVLDLTIDPATYLPSDDSTHGFDNIAGALGLSSTLVEAYVLGAQKISRLAIGDPEPPTLTVYRAPEDSSQDYHIEGLPFGTRGGLVRDHLFPSDGEYTLTVTPIFGDNMSPTGFGSVPCEKLEILLDGTRLDLLDWQGGRGGGGRGGSSCNSSPVARGTGGGAAAQAPAGGGRGRGGRGGNQGMRVRFTTTAGQHTIGATFLTTNLAPLLDLDRHFMRSTLQTGPTPGYTFFPHVGTIRIEGPFNATPAKDSPSRARVFICTPAAPAEEEACARRIVSNLATRFFRRPATDADVGVLMEFYRSGRDEGTFDGGIGMALARILASPQFIYRIEQEPARAAADEAYRLSDVALASRLSFFLWSTGPDEALLSVAVANRLRNPEVLEQQVRRMLRDPKAEALAVNFAGQWLNLRGLQSAGPLPMIYPDFDDPLRQAMRREVELLFDSIVREDRNAAELLTADYTFVNERLAKHYGIRNVYGSHFRRVTLPPSMDYRRGLLGKGAFLTTTSKPERTSPVTRGKWIMTNILGMSPPDPPPNVPALPPRAADAAGNAREPTMRKKMEDHLVRADCRQCHTLMDPIGFSLENFDGIGLWRTLDEGQPINAAASTFDNSTVDGPDELRDWLVSKYSTQFVSVVAEKLLVYALGRGVEHQDMPLIRAITRDAVKSSSRFSSLVLGVVTSRPFHMNMPVQGSADLTAAARSNTNQEGTH